MDSAVKPQNDHMLFLHTNYWTMPMFHKILCFFNHIILMH